MGPDGTKLLEKGGHHVRPLFVGTKLSSQRAGALWLPGGEVDQYEIVGLPIGKGISLEPTDEPKPPRGNRQGWV